MFGCNSSDKYLLITVILIFEACNLIHRYKIYNVFSILRGFIRAFIITSLVRNLAIFVLKTAIFGCNSSDNIY